MGLDDALSYLLAFHPSPENLFERNHFPPCTDSPSWELQGNTKCTLCGQEVKEGN